MKCCRCCYTCAGGLSPVKATDAMIKPVGQRDGQLYTEPDTGTVTYRHRVMITLYGSAEYDNMGTYYIIIHSKSATLMTSQNVYDYIRSVGYYPLADVRSITSGQDYLVMGVEAVNGKLRFTVFDCEAMADGSSQIEFTIQSVTDVVTPI